MKGKKKKKKPLWKLYEEIALFFNLYLQQTSSGILQVFFTELVSKKLFFSIVLKQFLFFLFFIYKRNVENKVNVYRRGN